MEQFATDQLRRQRLSYLKAIVGLEALLELSATQAVTLERYKGQVARIEGELTDNHQPFEA